MKQIKLEIIAIGLIIFTGSGLSLNTIITFAELSSPTAELPIPELEKSKMQTIYEDDKKKIMLPYDPELISHYMIVGMFMTFLGGACAGYVLNEMIRKREKSTKETL